MNPLKDPDIHLPKSYNVLQQPRKCENGVDLLFAIKSIPKNGDRRDGLRNSWLDPELYDGVRVRHVFLFGKQDIGPIQKEIDRFGDALVGDFIDSFHNLTFKDAMILQWAQDSCHARFILKGDDDVFVSSFVIISIFILIFR